MQWAYPERLMWLWLVPAVALLWWWAARARRRALEQLVEPALAPALADSVSWRARRWKAGLAVGGLAALIVTLAGPQWGFEWEEVTRRGADLVVALDVSKSMLAEDVKPNRLERAKLAIEELVGELRGDRIGLAAFAGTAFLQCPLTTDYGALTLILRETSVDAIPRGGTAIGQAIRASLKALERSASESRAIVLITDGEDHEGDALPAARAAATVGVPVHCIGIGTPGGELIPLEPRAGFVKDEDGRVVKSRLDEALLQRIAQETGGRYVRATPTDFGLDEIYREAIAPLEDQEFGTERRKRYQHQFQWPLALAFLLLTIEALLSDRRRLAAWIVLALLGTTSTVMATEELPDADKVTQARRALERRPDDPVRQYNLGTLLYGAGEYDEASRLLQQALAGAPAAWQPRAAYNLGNAVFRQAEALESSDPAKAADAYRQALADYQIAKERDPADEDAAFNYDVTKQRLEALEQTMQQQQSAGEQGQEQAQQQPAAGDEQREADDGQGELSEVQPIAPEHAQRNEQTQQEAAKPEGDKAEEQAARESLWILDAAQQEELEAREAQLRRHPARETPVGKDW